MPTQIDKQDARQARTGFGVRRILVISMSLAALTMLSVAVFTG